jgi:hypothetical protein
MGFSLLTIASFKNVFTGNYSVKGRTNTAEKNTAGKLEGKSWLDKTSITNEDIIKHLEGQASIGMSPIDEKGMVGFGVIDIDDYTNIVEDYIRMVHTFNIPLNLFYSKSKGIHAYIFFTEPVKPSDAVDLLTRIRILLGLPKDTELFPKQRSADKVSYGSWINLPYFAANDPNNPRKLIREDGTLAPVEEALTICQNSKRTVQEINDLLDLLPLADAPPCIQTIYLKQKTEYRNEYLFNLGVYYKAKYEDNFENELAEANKMLLEPVEPGELEITCLNSLRKKDYHYKCGQPPINLLCNKAACRERKNGTEGDSISSLSFEDFIQYETDPPYYEWIINGQTLKFFHESDIINQYAFRELVFRKLHYLPPKVSDAKWTRIVNNAQANIEIRAVEKESDVSTGGVWLKHITEFFTTRVQAANKQQLKAGRTYRDNDLKCYIFSGTALLEYIRSKGFRAYSDVEVQSRLKELGARQVQYDIAPGQAIKCWSLLCEKIDLMSMDTEDITIDFYDTLQEGDKY